MIRSLIAAAAVALALAGGAAAATLDDLRALGYTVYLQFDNGTCRAWTVVGFGVNSSLGCEGTADFQLALARLADPALHFERKWQFEHPEQLAAANDLVAKGYAVNRTAPATDSWSVVGGETNVVVAGADLPGLAASLPKLDASAGPSQTVPNVGSDGSVTAPGGATVSGPTTSETEPASTETTDSSTSATGSETTTTSTASTFRTTDAGLLWTDEATAARLIVPRGKFVVF